MLVTDNFKMKKALKLKRENIKIVFLKGVLEAGKAFSEAHKFLFLYKNLIRILRIVVRNLWNTFYF